VYNLMMERYSLEELSVDCRNNIDTDLTDIVWEGVAWIKLTQNMDQWQDIMDTVMNLLYPQNATDINLQQTAYQEVSSVGGRDVARPTCAFGRSLNYCLSFSYSLTLHILSKCLYRIALEPYPTRHPVLLQISLLFCTDSTLP
jgi:hypothetical protein